MIMNPFRFGSVAAASTEFTSMYESRSALTTVQKQHFVEWFSGSALNTDRWATHGSGTIAMANEVDGGLKITSATSGTTKIDFGSSDALKKRPFSGSGCVMITVAQLTEVQYGIMTIDLQDHYLTEVGDSVNSVVYGNLNGASGSQEKFKLVSTEFANIDLSIATSQLYLEHVHKLELKSASTELSIDGVLEATGGASITLGVQPGLEASAAEGAAASIANFRYCEVYNT